MQGTSLPLLLIFVLGGVFWGVLGIVLSHIKPKRWPLGYWVILYSVIGGIQIFLHTVSHPDLQLALGWILTTVIALLIFLIGYIYRKHMRRK